MRGTSGRHRATVKVLRTVDGGRHWQRVMTPVANLSGSYLGAVDFVDNQHGWVVSSAGTVGDQFVFSTADGGRTWDQQGPRGDPANLFGIDSVDGRTVVAVGYACCVGPQITRSTDSGETWEVLPQQLSPYGGRYRAVQLATVSTGWISGDAGALLKTTDGGATWRQQNPLGLYGSGATFVDPSFASEQSGWVAAYVSSSEGFLLHTTDGGRTWVKQPVPVPAVTRVVATPGGGVWVGGDGAVGHSTDGGDTWTVERPARNASYGAIAVAGSDVWAAVPT
ncbi:MAG: WD40/YVTN/BNR-like repeat-containing protein [Nocardioidaceae bacterium]